MFFIIKFIILIFDNKNLKLILNRKLTEIIKNLKKDFMNFNI